MTLYVYCPRKSKEALSLVLALNARRLRRFDGMYFWDKRNLVTLGPDPVIVCWGASVPEMEGVRVLNAMPSDLDNFERQSKLQENGIPAVLVSQTQGKLGQHFTLLKRARYHYGGSDILPGTNSGTETPYYYAIRENFVAEYRLHKFGERVLKAGVKVPREGFTIATEETWKPGANLAHPWIRTYEAGWDVNYDGFIVSPHMRKLVKSTMAVFGLTFAAVDIAELPSGSLKVIGVNSGPIVDDTVMGLYLKEIRKWIVGGNGEVGG